MSKLTVCCSLTMPWSLTTLGCRNWPMMAPSCRNLTLSSSLADDLRVFMATSSVELGLCHTPLLTVPNCPEPRHSVALCDTWERGMGARLINDVIAFAQLMLLVKIGTFLVFVDMWNGSLLLCILAA